ncbi:MAG: glutamate 5-kinase [Candidatus Omnitrophota bacterium]
MKRITIKVGTKVLTNEDNRIDQKIIRNLSNQLADLMDKKIEVVLVSSGAIGAGLGLLSVKKRGRSLSELQAIASIGQNHLMEIYNRYLAKRGYIAGQVLLTQEDFNHRRRFLNIRHTVNSLLKYKAIPVINENDSVSTSEIKCGDNDRLSSLVADLTGSDMFIVLTDVEGVYDDKAKLISQVENLEKVIKKLKSFCSGKGSEESTGGMRTKIDAVRNAANSGIKSVIAYGRRKNVLNDIVSGKRVGTRFESAKKTLKARKRWIAFSIKAKGKIIVDKGAEKALVDNKKSLLPSGILQIEGKFSEGDVVEIFTTNKKIIARGLSNYSSEEIKKIRGKKSGEIEAELGYKDYDEIVHRDNLVIVE